MLGQAYDLASALLLPPASLLLFIGVGWLLRRRWPRASRGLIIAAVALLYLLSTPLIAGLLQRGLEGDRVVTSAETRLAEAIVVPGGDLYLAAAEYGGDTVGALTAERLRYAADLQRATGLPILVAGGHIGESELPVAVTMQRALIDQFGVPVRWIEFRSKNTWQNGRFSARTLGASHVKRILLVTHAWHMQRAKAAFAEAGFEVIAAPTALTRLPEGIRAGLWPDATALATSASAIHEWIGILWYRLALPFVGPASVVASGDERRPDWTQIAASP
jgi:uncharacterized SAM-binding protein YcdF (DUF218 family)